MSNKKKLTPEVIRRLVREERAKLNETLELKLKHPSDAAKKTREVDATGYADTLSKCMNYYQMCKLKEAKLEKELRLVKEAKKRLKTRILKSVK